MSKGPTIRDSPDLLLADRIRQFEARWNALTDRAETLWSCPDPSGRPGHYIAFCFHCAGDTWIISWDHDDEFKQPQDTTWRPLTNAPAEIQRAAINTFDALWQRQTPSRS